MVIGGRGGIEQLRTEIQLLHIYEIFFGSINGCRTEAKESGELHLHDKDDKVYTGVTEKEIIEQIWKTKGVKK